MYGYGYGYGNRDQLSVGMQRIHRTKLALRARAGYEDRTEHGSGLSHYIKRLVLRRIEGGYFAALMLGIASPPTFNHTSLLEYLSVGRDARKICSARLH